MEFVTGVFNWIRKLFTGNSRNGPRAPSQSNQNTSRIQMSHNHNCNLHIANPVLHYNQVPDAGITSYYSVNRPLLMNPEIESYYKDINSTPSSSVSSHSLALEERDYYKTLTEKLLQERIQTAEVPRLSNEDMENKVKWVLRRGKNIKKLKNIAVVAGHECDGTPLWAIRTRHLSNLLPAKLNAKSKIAYVAWNDQELVVKNAYEVLCVEKGRVIWQEASDGWVPYNAVPAGKTRDGESLYMGRVTHSCALVPGKIQPSRKSCYITYKGSVFASSRYEVMCVT